MILMYSEDGAPWNEGIVGLEVNKKKLRKYIDILARTVARNLRDFNFPSSGSCRSCRESKRKSGRVCGLISNIKVNCKK